MEKKLVPYNLYLHIEHVEMLKKLAAERKASSLIREAISMMLDGKDEYSSGYNRALKDAAEEVQKCKQITFISISGEPVADILSNRIIKLTKKSK